MLPYRLLVEFYDPETTFHKHGEFALTSRLSKSFAMSSGTGNNSVNTWLGGGNGDPQRASLSIDGCPVVLFLLPSWLRSCASLAPVVSSDGMPPDFSPAPNTPAGVLVPLPVVFDASLAAAAADAAASLRF
jgi:hypothetical protein